MGKPMSAVFIGHGNPMNTLQDNAYTRGWALIGREVPRPKAVLSISAHWYIPGTSVTSMPAPRTIHDFGGFPPELYQIRYPAPGDPALKGRGLQTPCKQLPLEEEDEYPVPRCGWTDHWGRVKTTRRRTRLCQCFTRKPFLAL